MRLHNELYLYDIICAVHMVVDTFPCINIAVQAIILPDHSYRQGCVSPLDIYLSKLYYVLILTVSNTTVGMSFIAFILETQSINIWPCKTMRLIC